MRELPESSVDSVVCDPPYFLSFMGRKWDTSPTPLEQQRQHEAWAREALRVLKPGGYLLAAGGTRTFHRLVCALEDVGFEIRDTVAHLYGSGFPKSKSMRDIGRPELGTALKPAFEPWTMARKLLSEKSVAKQVLSTGTGAINVDGCRVGIDATDKQTVDKRSGSYNGKRHGIYGDDAGREHGERFKSHTQGRWPANLILSHAPECERVGVKRVANRDGQLNSETSTNGLYDFGSPLPKKATRHADPDGTEEVEALECVEGCPVAELDRQSEVSKSKAHTYRNGSGIGLMNEKSPETTTYDYGEVNGGHTDKGGASRFFYIAKASRKERNAGLEGMPEKIGFNKNTSKWKADARHPDGGYENNLSKALANHHPTVKPIALMRYLVRMVTPPGGTVLDPFIGSGSTGCAAVLEGMDFIGIEREEEYIEIAKRRIEHHAAESRERLFS